MNRAIAEAHRNGIVTSATLMATGKEFGVAAAMASSLPKLSVGCHIVLVDGEPVSPASQVESLLADSRQFPSGFGALARKAASGRLSSEQISREVCAQIEKLQQAGVRISHVDSHKHVHMIPAIAKPLIRAAAACGVRAIRNPFVSARPLPINKVLHRSGLWVRYFETAMLRGLQRNFLSLVTDAGLLTTNGSFGVICTGSLDLELFLAIADCIPDGTWEFVCHPGYVDDQLSNIRTKLRQSRETELSVLTSEEARGGLSRNGIELISYRELSAN